MEKRERVEWRKVTGSAGVAQMRPRGKRSCTTSTYFLPVVLLSPTPVVSLIAEAQIFEASFHSELKIELESLVVVEVEVLRLVDVVAETKFARVVVAHKRIVGVLAQSVKGLRVKDVRGGGAVRENRTHSV